MSRLQEDVFIRSTNGVSRPVFPQQDEVVLDKRAGILDGLFGNADGKGKGPPKLDIPVKPEVGKDPKDDKKPDPPNPAPPPESVATSVSSTPTASVNEPLKTPDSAANNTQTDPTAAESQDPSSTNVQAETQATPPAEASTSLSSINTSTPDASNKEVPSSSVSNAATQPSPAPLAASLASSSTTSTNNVLPATHDQALNPTLTHTTPTATNAHAFLGDETSSSKLVGNRPGNTDPANPFIGAAETSSHGSSRISTGAILGLSIGSLVIVCLVAFLVWFFRKRSADNRGERLNSPVTDTFGGSTTGGRSMPAILRNQFEKWFPGRETEDGTPDMNNGDTNTANKNEASVQNVPSMSEKHDIFGYYPSPTARNVGAGFGAGQNKNPFSDRNAITSPPQLPSLPPATLFSSSFGDVGKKALEVKSDKFGAEVLPPAAPHSRGRSLTALPRTSHYTNTNAPVSRAHSVHRESLKSAADFSGKRDKFHSNPFDLEIESGLISSQSLIPSNPGLSMASSTTGQSSRRTSGGSLGDWNIVRQSWTMESATPVPTVKWDSSLGEGTQNSEQPKFVFGQTM